MNDTQASNVKDDIFVKSSSSNEQSLFNKRSDGAFDERIRIPIEYNMALNDSRNVARNNSYLKASANELIVNSCMNIQSANERPLKGDTSILHSNRLVEINKSKTTCSSTNITKASPRTPLKIVEALILWYKHFLPNELIYIFYLNRRWSVYDSDRDHHIAIAFRNNFGTQHDDEIIRSLLSFFHSRPEIQLVEESMIHDDLFQSRSFIHVVPFTRVCPLCKQLLSASDSDSRQVKVICEQGKIVYGTLFWLECRHFGEHKKSATYFIFPNFIRVGREHIYSITSLYYGRHIYLGGCHVVRRSLISTYSCNIVGNANSWWETCESLNLEAFNEGLEQVERLCWKRLSQILFMYKVIEYHFLMGCTNIKIPMALRDFDSWSWQNFPKMLCWFIYLWTSHKEIIGPCDDKCSAAVIIDGHQKCRRRVCRYKDVEVKTDEFEKLAVGCCRSPLPKSLYCCMHQACSFTEETSSSIMKKYKINFRGTKFKHKERWKKAREETFGATGCRTNKACSDLYVRQCSRSFGLIACVTNCRVFISFGEIFRSETLREILHLLFSTIRVAGKLPSAGCYDDGCNLIKYLHNHIGNDLKPTEAAIMLSNIKFSVDRTHFKNHVGKWCRKNMNPDENRLLDNINTEAAEQNFSWLKKYASIISALGWRRSPVFILLLFHMKNLARCHVRPNRIFDIVNKCKVVEDVSLSHSKKITQMVSPHSSSNVKLTINENYTKPTTNANKKESDNLLIKSTNTDWDLIVAVIRKNNNIVDYRRHKKLKRL